MMTSDRRLFHRSNLATVARSRKYCSRRCEMAERLKKSNKWRVGKKKHLQFNAAVQRVKATRFYARSHIPNFDLVSNTIKRGYIRASSACIMINHFLRVRIIWFCKSRTHELFERFWKTIDGSKMTYNIRFIMEVNHEQAYSGYQSQNVDHFIRNYMTIHGCFA